MTDSTYFGRCPRDKLFFCSTPKRLHFASTALDPEIQETIHLYKIFQARNPRLS